MRSRLCGVALITDAAPSAGIQWFRQRLFRSGAYHNPAGRQQLVWTRGLARL